MHSVRLTKIRIHVQSAGSFQESRSALRLEDFDSFTLVTAVLLGLGYPLLVTGLANVLFPHQAAGSLICSRMAGDRLGIDGAELHRPTSTSIPALRRRATATTPTSSGGPNLAQSNKALVTRIQGDIDKLAAENPGKPVPIDMVTTPARASIPTLRPDNAYYQAARVAKARSLCEDRLRQLVANAHSRPRSSAFSASRA